MKHIPLALLLALALSCAPAFAGDRTSARSTAASARAPAQPYGDLETVNGGITSKQARPPARSRPSTAASRSATARSHRRGHGQRRHPDRRATWSPRAASKPSTAASSSTAAARSTAAWKPSTARIGLVRSAPRRQYRNRQRRRHRRHRLAGQGRHQGREARTSTWLHCASKRKPRVIIGPNAVVDGTLVFEREVKLYVHRSAHIGPVTGASRDPFDTDAAPQD